ncbi:MAG: TadE family protein, partial [Myxococcota bacterium]
ILTNESGAAFVEFLLAIIPLWVLFLCLVQWALVAQANLLVKHAADVAARSASVVLPDDPERYGGEPQMSVARGSVELDTLGRDLSLLASAVVDDSQPNVSSSSRIHVGRSRLNTIRWAANVRLVPLAPVSTGLAGSNPTVRSSLPSPRSPLGALIHLPYSAAVTFPGQSVDSISGEEVTVRVTYAFRCQVPLARRLLCSRFPDPETSDLDESFAPFLRILAGGYYKAIRRETTSLIQRAPYQYRPRGQS